MEEMIAHLTKIYADAPETFTHSRGTRPGYRYKDRELWGHVGPLTADEALAACEAMPRGYNVFTRDALHERVSTLAERGATTFYFGREASPCIYFDGPFTVDDVADFFPDADEREANAPNPLTGERMCRVWWD